MGDDVVHQVRRRLCCAPHGTATASGLDRATKAADQAVACPLLDGIDLSGARGVQVLILASKGTFKLAESRNAMNTIRRYAADDTHVSYGTAYDKSLGDQLRVTVIATGLTSARKAQGGKPPLAVEQPALQGQHAQPHGGRHGQHLLAPVLLPNLGGSLPNDVFADILGLPTV